MAGLGRVVLTFPADSALGNIVMVEARVTHDTLEKKSKEDPSSSLPVLSHMSSSTIDPSTSMATSPLLSTFQQVVSACSLVASSSSLESRLSSTTWQTLSLTLELVEL